MPDPQAFLAGGIAGASEVALTMPFEVTKNRVQLAGATRTTILSNMADTWARAGLGGFYFGVQAQLLQVVGKTAIRYTAYDALTRLLPGQNFLCGMGAGCFEGMVWVAPTERLKLLRQAELSHAPKQQQHGNILSSTRLIVSTQGIQGLLVGAGPTVVRQGTANGVRFCIYERIVAELRRWWPDGTKWHATLAGGLTGAVSTAITNPVDVVKTRAQTASVASRGISSLALARMLVAEEGAAVLLRGLAPRLIKISLGQAVIFGVYDAALRRLRTS